ncbi:MAG: pyridoxine 5'-phosphate synthase [Deltaproteobacteria bacterium]|nr:pyridoxine 5'-phosphate synthase [Deltaproteobacteria bacterium]
MSRTFLSVNVNKYALVRNSRGHNAPDLLWSVATALEAGAHGITVHPRRDQRHVRFDDVPAVRDFLRAKYPGVEFNIEFENSPELVELVLANAPEQATLVPVDDGEVTSSHGWDLARHGAALEPTVRRLKDAGIRVSLFMDPVASLMQGAADIGADRVELYTGPYAWAWGTPEQEAQTAALWEAGAAAVAAGMTLNAGHDLDSDNLAGVVGMPGLKEVSIGHAQIVRALEVGTTQSVTELLRALGW